MERLFIGIPVYDLFKNEIEVFYQTYQKLDPRWKWIHLQNAHITLHFFGNFPVEKKAWLINIFQQILKDALYFEISLSGLGSFKDSKNNGVKVVWLDVHSSCLKKLLDLHTLIMQGLNNAGFNLGFSIYRPHVTLFRLNRDMAQTFDSKRLHFPQTLPRRMSEMVLYKSHLTEMGAIYSRESVFFLK